jgi:hypothetical protein
MARETFWTNRLEHYWEKKRVNHRSTRQQQTVVNVVSCPFGSYIPHIVLVGIALGGRVPNKESLAHAFDSIFGENY